MVCRKSLLAVFFTVILVLSVFAGSVGASTVAIESGTDTQAIDQSPVNELVT